MKNAAAAAPRRVAFVSTLSQLPWGGSEELWSQAAHRLLAAGVEVRAAVSWHPQEARPLRELSQAGCPVHHVRFGLPHRVVGRLRRDLRRLQHPWLARFRPDLLVLSQAYHVQGADWFADCRRLGIPYVTVTQAAGEEVWPGDTFLLPVAEGLEAARTCYFVAEGNVRFVRSFFGTPLPNARIVRNPFKVSYDAAPPWPQEGEALKLACVARLMPGAKGQDILFDVLRSDKWRGRRLEVTLFGDGPNAQTLARLKSMYGLENVRFGGVTSDIEQVWATHHALVLTSRYEGLPLAVVEAMLCGRPCIVTDVAGNAEAVEDNVSGFVAAAAKAEFVDEALERAWARRAEWRQMGQAAARCIRALVPPDPVGAFADDLLQVLDRVGSGRAAGSVAP